MRQRLRRGYAVETSYAEAKDIYMKAWSWPKLVTVYIKVYYADWHFTWLRRQFSRPAAIYRAAFLEKLFRAPFSLFIRNEDKQAFDVDDFLMKRGCISKETVNKLSTFLRSQEKYFDIYQGLYEQNGLHAPGAPATIYVRTCDFVRSEAFWQIITSPIIHDVSRNILGARAKLTWAWLWYSKPDDEVYQNQNWHRDTGEPFNFLRVFVPLTNVRDADDGPTIVVKGSTRRDVLYERRRFTVEEVEAALGTGQTVMALADVGDIYCANTYCLHRGLPPRKPREMLSLLISYQNSYRTKGLPLVPVSSLTEKQQAFVMTRKYFFSEVCDFKV